MRGFTPTVEKEYRVLIITIAVRTEQENIVWVLCWKSCLRGKLWYHYNSGCTVVVAVLKHRIRSTASNANVLAASKVHWQHARAGG